jgi:hypothetical protein
VTSKKVTPVKKLIKKSNKKSKSISGDSLSGEKSIDTPNTSSCSDEKLSAGNSPET